MNLKQISNKRLTRWDMLWNEANLSCSYHHSDILEKVCSGEQIRTQIFVLASGKELGCLHNRSIYKYNL